MAELYNFQKTAVSQLMNGKHIIVAGCLAGGTKIPLANGEIKNVEDIKSGDKLISYDEDKSMFVENEVDIMFRTCHKPKPMIKLEYEGETITTTYDHPFFNGEGYYPLYQLIWGALEASQRVQLKLLCEQYGQAFNDKAIRCKHCSSNETVSGRKWVLQNDDEWEDCKSTQNSSGELARKSQRIGLCEPFELRQNRQQSGQPRVVLSEVQRLVWDKAWQNKNPQEPKANERLDDARQPEHTKFLSRQYAGKNEHGEEKTLRCFSKEIPASRERQAEGGCDWKATVLEAEPYYTISMRTAPYTYCIGQKHYFVTHNCGAGKTAMALVWAEQKCMTTGKDKVVVVTTASKSRTGDFEQEAEVWCPSLLNSLSSFSVLSWHKLRAWVEARPLTELSEYVYVFDECLTADTKVKTSDGEKEIADLKIGDKVLSYNHAKNTLEYKKITRLIKREAPQRMYRLLLRNGTAIISTGNHPHWTQDGYKEAKDIKKGDLLYATEVHKLQDTEVRESKKVRVVREGNPSGGMDGVSSEKLIGREEVLLRQRRMRQNVPEEKIERVKKDKQPYGQPSVQAESNGYKEEKRMATNMDREPRLKGWQRKVYQAAKNLMEETERGEQRVGNGTTSVSRGVGAWVPQELQIRHRQFLPQNRNRMRWRQPQFGKDKSERQEEGEEIRGVRVESVEVLKLGDIKRLGLYRDSDNVYCIDVEDNHNFFANGVLTHNCQRAKAGVSSGMGRSFLKITRYSSDWAAFTGTPGDTWLSFYPYLQACGLVRNKTGFLYKYATVQTYKGYPEIVGWRYEDQLKEMWGSISYAPDTEKVMSELPEQTHKVIEFKRPPVYRKILKTRYTESGEFLDTAGALCAELRRQCFTKEKQEWVKDFVDGLESGCVFFYNFVKTGDELEEIIQKALPKGARVWRIDGTHHEIPNADTVGPNDMVLCQWQSGSEALNLQFLHYWCSVEACYSYSTSIQARGRIRRLGQKSPQFYYYLKTVGTIEDAVYQALATKSDFAEANWCVDNNITEE